MLSSQDAKNVLVLLSRTNLAGNEAVAYVQLVKKLQEIADTPDSSSQTSSSNGKI